MNTAPRKMTANTLNALKGWPNPYAVDYSTAFDASLAGERVPAGSVVRLSAAGNYLLGVGANVAMPMFLFNNSDDPDVVNYGGDPATEKGPWVGFGPTGSAMALPAVGGLELVSTQFVAGQTYNCNTLLTSPADAAANAGRLIPGIQGTDTICGMVSRSGVQNNGYGHNSISFWPLVIFPTA